MQVTKRLKIGKTEQLDKLAHEVGIVYSQTLVYYRRILRKKGIFLTKTSMQRLMRNGKLHSQTVQGITDIFYDNLSSYWKLHKKDARARLPKRRRWYFVLPYKAAAIRLQEGKLILSNGRGNEPLVIDWGFDEKPEFVRISFDGKVYVANAVYTIANPETKQTGETAGIDLGEIHLAVANMGKKTVIINGRELRSKRRYQNKAKGRFQQRLSKHRKGSRKYKQINRKKKQVLRRLDNQTLTAYELRSYAVNAWSIKGHTPQADCETRADPEIERHLHRSHRRREGCAQVQRQRQTRQPEDTPDAKRQGQGDGRVQVPKAWNRDDARRRGVQHSDLPEVPESERETQGQELQVPLLRLRVPQGRRWRDQHQAETNVWGVRSHSRHYDTARRHTL